MITTLEVNRDELATSRVVTSPVDLDDGQILARIDRFAVTSNNVTYAVLGHTLGYWDFFPPAEAGWGRVPAFGYAEVVASRCSGVEEGTRVYGYFPMASHLVLEPGRINEHSFHDMAAHRQPMSEVYNRYAIAATDPLHDAARERQRMLLHPLFMTSFVIDDLFGDNDFFRSAAGANSADITAVISSASSKTAIGVGHLMQQRDNVRVVGLTSAGNLDFTTSLGCYDEVFTYDRVADLPVGPAVYVDISGSGTLKHQVHGHYGDQLGFSSAVGATDWADVAGGEGELAGPTPEFFFAPTQLQKRTEDWGREEMERRIVDAWKGYSRWTNSWLEVVDHDGVGALAELWAGMLPGRVDPKIGHVVHINETDGGAS